MLSDEDLLAEVERLRAGLEAERAAKTRVMLSVNGVIAELRRELKSSNAALQTAREALEGVLRVADRKTVQFDTARAALTAIDEALPQAENTAK